MSSVDSLQGSGPLELGDFAPPVAPAPAFVPIVPPVSATKPTSPADGQLWRYAPASRVYCEWLFAWSALIGVWAFVGGSAADEADGSAATYFGPVGVWDHVTSPAYPAPFAGVYDIRQAALAQTLSGVSQSGIATMLNGAGPNYDTQGFVYIDAVTGGSVETTLAVQLAAGDVITLGIWGDQTGHGLEFVQRQMWVTPRYLFP